MWSAGCGVRLEAPGAYIYPSLYVEDAAGNVLTSVGGDYSGKLELDDFTIPRPGTIYLDVISYYNPAAYQMRVDLSQVNLGPQLETISNNSKGNATLLNITSSAQGGFTGSVAGALWLGNNGDCFGLGTLNGGNAISLTTSAPSFSSLNTGSSSPAVQLSLLQAGNNTAVATSSTGTLNYTIPSGADGAYYVLIQALSPVNQSIRAQYLLNVSVIDGVSPTVTATSLPAEGGSTQAILNGFTLNFSKDLAASTVNNTANYNLQDSNGNVYHLASPGYSNGLSATYQITDGPFQVGSYTLTISGITDRAQNPLAPAPFVLHFEVNGVTPFILENRRNDSLLGATSLSPTPSTQFDGSFTAGGYYNGSQYINGLTTGDFNGDGHPDVVTANLYNQNISVLLNNGDGTFGAPIMLSAGNGPIAVAVGDVNSDGKADIVVADYSGDTVTVLLGDGHGRFSAPTDASGGVYGVGSNPYDVKLVDLGNGQLDIVTANLDGNVSVLLGHGDSTFAPAVSYAAGSGSIALAVGDVDNDPQHTPDLVVSDFYSNTVSVLLGNGDGTLAAPVSYATGVNPRGVALADLNGDGMLDIAVANTNSNSVSVLLNNGARTFGTATSFGSGASTPEQVVALYNPATGNTDLAVANFSGGYSGQGNVAVFRGDGHGNFSLGTTDVVSGTYVNALGTADVNGDGLPDLLAGSYYGSYVTVLAANTVKSLAQDPSGSGLYSGYGRGNNSNYYDYDYWSFTGKAGQLLTVAVDVPGHPYASYRSVYIYRSDGTYLSSFGTAYYGGEGQSSPFALPNDGTYYVLVTYAPYPYEYDLRVTLADPPLQIETESNNSIGSANGVTYTTNGNAQVASVAGAITVPGDLDYFNLGTIQAGYSILLSTRLPSTSGLNPVVFVYDAFGDYLVKTNGRPFDGVGQIDITQTGTYYALMLGGNGTSGLLDQYILDVQIVLTSSLTQLPNLEVTNISLPTAGESGQPVTFSWTVTNVGQAATNVANWSDRAVLSLDTTYGNSDDIPLAVNHNNGVFPHQGILAPGASYTVTETVTLPDGISGNYHIIVQTDSSTQVNENAIGRGDAVTVSTGGSNGDGTFTVNLAPYPDLVVQGLTVNGPNPDGTFTVSWNTANQGNADVTNGWKEHLIVKDLTTGGTVEDTVVSWSGVLAAGNSVAHTLPLTGSYTLYDAGHFQVTVTTNSDQSVYEDNPQGHHRSRPERHHGHDLRRYTRPPGRKPGGSRTGESPVGKPGHRHLGRHQHRQPRHGGNVDGPGYRGEHHHEYHPLHRLCPVQRPREWQYPARRFRCPIRFVHIAGRRRRRGQHPGHRHGQRK